MSLIKVNKNENPYDVIGNYIEKHVSVIDNIIAVISINRKIRNELLLVDGEIDSANNFVWQIDWWEGEENIELIDFFFVSDACKKYNDNDLVNRRAAINAAIEAADDWDGGCNIGRQKRIENYINKLPSAQPEIIRCKDCKHWNKCSCECREHAVNCQDYMVGDIETEAEHFCGYAERREVTT